MANPGIQQKTSRLPQFGLFGLGLADYDLPGLPAHILGLDWGCILSKQRVAGQTERQQNKGD